MERTKNDLAICFSNIGKALKTYSVAEFNTAVIEVLKSQETDLKKAEVNKVLDIVAEQFSISKRTLIKSSGRGTIQTAKFQAYLLLHFDLGLNTRYIAERVFDKWQNSIMCAIRYYKSLNTEIPEDREFLEVYTLLQKKIINN